MWKTCSSLKKSPKKTHISESLFNKDTGRQPKACNFIKKETLAQVFSCDFCENSKNIFSTEHLWMTASGLSMSRTKITTYYERNFDIDIFQEIWQIFPEYLFIDRSSHRRFSWNSTKFTGKYLSQSLFFNKFAGLILQNTSGWLLQYRTSPSDYNSVNP